VNCSMVHFDWKCLGKGTVCSVFILEGPDSGRSFELRNLPLSVGRFPDNHIVLRDDFVSRKHFALGKTDKGYFIEDLWSKNGTYVNGEKIAPGIKVPVEERHFIAAGRTLICLSQHNSAFVKAYLGTVKALKTWEPSGMKETLMLKIGRTL
jgi:predicted component of type VI protein secretion system